MKYVIDKFNSVVLDKGNIFDVEDFVMSRRSCHELVS